MKIRSRAYRADGTIALYLDPANGTATPYNTPGGITFGPSNKITSTNGQEWVLGGYPSRKLYFSQPGEGSYDHPTFSLSYTSYGYFQTNTSGNNGIGRNVETWFYFGIPTASSDLPRSGSAYYTGYADGSIYDLGTEYKLKGTATLTADFAGGDIETALQLFSNGPSGNPGMIEGLAKLSSNDNTFAGTFLASSNGYYGGLQGAFFGPAAAEFGYSFLIYKPDFSVLGGGVAVGGQDTSVPPLPPPPPPPPPPAPPPAPAGSTFPLSGSATFGTATASYGYTGSALDGVVSRSDATLTPFSNQVTITVTPDYANGTYTVKDGTSSTTFHLPDGAPTPDPSFGVVTLTDGDDDQLLLFNNLAYNIGTNDPLSQLHYLSYAFLFQNDAATSQHKTTALLFGIPTPIADLPRSGSAKYTTQGRAYATYGFGNYADVQGELTADFAAGTIANTFTLSNYRGASVMDFYRANGGGTIASGTSLFAGSLTTTDGTLTGNYNGSFFGPNAEEAGFTFSLNGTYNGLAQQIVGAAGGKR